MPSGFPASSPSSTRPRARPELAHRHAGVHEPEGNRTAERDLPPVLELVSVSWPAGLDEEARCRVRVRKKRHDRHERERRMKTAPEQRSSTTSVPPMTRTARSS